MKEYLDRLKQLLEDVEDLASDIDADSDLEDFEAGQRIVSILDSVRQDIEDAKKLAKEQ